MIIDDMHFGRHWNGPGEFEKDCPCHKAECGLVDIPVQECDQHWPGVAKTMRSIHDAADCPTRRKDE